MAFMVSLNFFPLVDFSSLSTVPTPRDPRPGRFVHHLDFNHFRTIGMRRSVEESVNSRFVTGDRVQAVLKVFLSSLLLETIDVITHIITGNAKPHCLRRYRVHGRRPYTPCVG